MRFRRLSGNHPGLLGFYQAGTGVCHRHNAIQYTPAGGYVAVILKRSNGDAVIEVEDTGIGIAPDEQKLIFDRFHRVNSDRSRSTGGSGLGLAIATAIVQAHGGSIQVQSQLGKGSTFIVHLPLTVTRFSNFPT